MMSFFIFFLRMAALVKAYGIFSVPEMVCRTVVMGKRRRQTLKRTSDRTASHCCSSMMSHTIFCR